MKKMFKKTRKKQKTLGQVTLEFTFCFLVILLIFYSCVKAIQWLGVALVKPGLEHQVNTRGTLATPNYPGDTVSLDALKAPLDRPTGELPPMDLIYRDGGFID